MRGIRFVDDDFLATTIGDIFCKQQQQSPFRGGLHEWMCPDVDGFVGWALQALPGKYTA